MKKQLLLTCLLAAFTIFYTNAQTTLPATPVDTTWRLGGFGSLQFSQVAFSNWVAGGESSVSLTAIASGFAQYKLEKNYWNSYGLLSYGAYRGQYDTKVRKNVDLIDIGTRAGHELGHKFYLTGLINFKSQFAPGYNYPNVDTVVSRFLAPGYLLISPGIEWKPLDYFSLFLSPATGKFTFVTDEEIADRGTYGNDPAVYDTLTGVIISHGKKTRSEFGALFVAAFAKDIAKNVNLATKLTLFDNYTDKVKENRGNMDVNWDLLLSMKVNNWLTASLYTSLIYDHDIFIPDLDKETGLPTGTGGPRTQFKEGLSIGLTYQFGEEERK
jgi:hypothetical protein